MTTTKFNTRPAIGDFQLESYRKNANFAERHNSEFIDLSVGSYVSGVSIDIKTTLGYQSGRSNTHYVAARLTADQCRFLAEKLVEIADKQDAVDTLSLAK